MISLTDNKECGPQLDITGPAIVDISVREDGKVAWINVDGICRLRICDIRELDITDFRKVVCDSYALENQRLFDRAEAAERERDAFILQLKDISP